MPVEPDRLVAIQGKLAEQPRLIERRIPYDPISTLRWSARIERGFVEQLAKDRQLWRELKRRWRQDGGQ